MHELPADDSLFALSLALLELIDQEITIELEQGENPASLLLQGTLLRAFDTPTGTSPTISIMLGGHSITIRLGPIRRIVYRHISKPKPILHSIHIHLRDNYSLHITALKPQTPNNNHP